MVKVNKNELANALKEVKRFCKEFCLVFGMLKDSFADARNKK